MKIRGLLYFGCISCFKKNISKGFILMRCRHIWLVGYHLPLPSVPIGTPRVMFAIATNQKSRRGLERTFYHSPQ
jgi:hypothetical protein